MKLRTKLWIYILISTLTSFSVFIGLTWWIGSLLNNGYTHNEIDQLGEKLISEVGEAELNEENLALISGDFITAHPVF